jgi:predicted nucleic acid-binding protein
MIQAVLDTNILVSALRSPVGNASAIVNLIFADKIIPNIVKRILLPGIADIIRMTL